MSDPGLDCCEAARTCAELVRLNGRDVEPPQEEPAWTLIVDVRPNSPCGMDLMRGAIRFCPFCGTAVDAAQPAPLARGLR